MEEQQKSGADIRAINDALGKVNILHYDGSRTDYAVNNYELDLIKSAGFSLWKDIFLACCGVGIPTLINAYAIYSNINEDGDIWTNGFFVNLLFGLLALLLGIISAILWQRNKSDLDKIITKIKGKEPYIIPSKEQQSS